MALYKNVASQKLAVYAHDTAADAAKTGDAANISAQISLDGGATAATNDAAPTELDATDAPGIYLFDLTQAETNADLVILCAVSSTGNVSIEPVVIYTLPGTNAGVAADAVAVSGDSTAADNLELACDNYSATRGLAGTALPAAAADAAGGLPISDAGGLDLDAMNTNVSAVLSDTGTDGVVLAADAITAAKIADDAIGDEHWNVTAAAANVTQINSSANAAARLALSAAQITPGTVDSTAHSPTTTEFEADDITEATADHYNGRLVLFTTGVLAGQVTDVTDYAIASGRGHFTVTAMTEAPGNDDTFVLV